MIARHLQILYNSKDRTACTAERKEFGTISRQCKGDGMSEKMSRAAEKFATAEPLVSVVIPVYNVSCYLTQCLESVISQTYRRLEIILVDDGSTDGSGSICDQYAKRDDRICVNHIENRGLASARNIGLEKAGGEYISFLDSDDWAEPHLIEVLLRAALLSDSDIVCAGYCFEYIGKTVHTSTAKKGSRTCRGKDILAVFTEGRPGNVVWNKLYRADVFKDIRFPDGHNYEDAAIIWKLMKKLAGNGGSVTVLPDELIHYRVRKNSISHTWSFHNVNDCWMAFYTKFEELPDYQEKLLDECFEPIRRMRMSFSDYSEEEKEKAEKTIREMQAYSRKHFSKVMKGNFPLSTKVSCLLSMSRSAPAMWISFLGKRLRQAFKNRALKMFD